MTLAILFKSGKLEMYDFINTMKIEKNKLRFFSGQLYEYSFTKPLDEVARILVDGIVYYEDGEAKI